MAILAVDVFGESEVSGWDVVLAAIVVVVALVAARAARNAGQRLADRLDGISPAARTTLARIAYWFVLLVGIGIALSVLGADIQPVQTAAIIAAVIAVIALRGVASQFAAGVVLQSRHPYRVGDHIETLDHIGVVRELNSYSTVVETYDGRIVHVPNAEVLAHPIVNRSAGGGLRLDIEVRASTTDDPSDVLATLNDVTASADGVMSQPPPLVSLRAAEPGRVTALVRAWHDPALDGPTVAGTIVATLSRRLTEIGIDAAVVTPPPPPPFTPSPPV